MNNALIAGIYAPFSAITAVILIIELRRQVKRRENVLFILLCLCTAAWFTANIAGTLTENEPFARFAVSFILIFVGFIPPILLLFVIRFYKVPWWPSLPQMAALLAVPCANTVVALTSLHHSWMTAELAILSMVPREIAIHWGPWFWVHTVYCYIVSAALIYIILSRHFRMPGFYRLPSTLMVAGVSMTLLGNLLYLVKIFPAALDPTPITTSLSLILFGLAISCNNKSKFVRLSHGQIYHYLDLYMLVLDETDQVVDFNRPADEWFTAAGIPLKDLKLEEILAALGANGRSVTHRIEGHALTDIHCQGAAISVILNLRVHEISDKKGTKLGSIAIFTDVTENRMLIDRLEEKAGMDPLTGLPNRMAYEGARQRLDAPEHLPLAVIMCDVNDLKVVNDTHGHKFGDKMLQEVGGLLEAACPRHGFAARIGGDEFIFLLPQTGHDEVRSLVDEMKHTLFHYDNLPFDVSVAMGIACKLEECEDLESVITLADSRMYEDKRRIKEASCRGQFMCVRR